MRNKTEKVYNFCEKPQLSILISNNAGIRFHYTIWGGCQILPKKLEVRIDLYSGILFSTIFLMIITSRLQIVLSKAKICELQQLQIQKGEQASLS